MKKKLSKLKIRDFLGFCSKKSKSRGFWLLPSGFFERKQIPNTRDLGIGIPKNLISKPPPVKTSYSGLIRVYEKLQNSAKQTEFENALAQWQIERDTLKRSECLTSSYTDLTFSGLKCLLDSLDL